MSKAIDRAAGAEREVTGPPPYTRGKAGQSYSETRRVSYDYQPQPATAPATEDATRWDGFGTALKPSHEPIVLARKPLAGTVAANVLAHGTGALNIDGCRVHAADSQGYEYTGVRLRPGATIEKTGGSRHAVDSEALPWEAGREYQGHTKDGRWPPNILLTHSPDCQPAGTRIVAGDRRAGQEPGTRPGGFGDVGADSGGERPNGQLHGPQVVEVFDCAEGCPVAELDAQSGRAGASAPVRGTEPSWTGMPGTSAYGEYGRVPGAFYGDQGGASRFFPCFRYQAKAPPRERPKLADGTSHPTVKPVALLRWLVRLVTPPGAVVLDPFAGTGTTLEAALLEGFRAIGIEREQAYCDLAVQRMSKHDGALPFGMTTLSVILTCRLARHRRSWACWMPTKVVIPQATTPPRTATHRAICPASCMRHDLPHRRVVAGRPDPSGDTATADHRHRVLGYRPRVLGAAARDRPGARPGPGPQLGGVDHRAGPGGGGVRGVRVAVAAVEPGPPVTCVAGIAENGAVYLCADSAGCSGWDLMVRADAKVFERGSYVLGFTDSFRMGQLLRYSFKPPDPPSSDLHGFMCTTFVDAVRECLRTGGWSTKHDEREAGGTFLAGVAGHLFVVHGDYQVSDPADCFAAIGCGAQVAHGALAALADSGIRPGDRLSVALQSAQRFSNGVRSPFVHVTGGRERG